MSVPEEVAKEYHDSTQELYAALSVFVSNGNAFARTAALMKITAGFMAVMHSDIIPEKRMEMIQEAFAGMRHEHDQALAILEKAFPDQPQTKH